MDLVANANNNNYAKQGILSKEQESIVDIDFNMIEPPNLQI